MNLDAASNAGLSRTFEEKVSADDPTMLTILQG